MADDSDDPVVTNPTYMGQVRFFFRQIDIDHMAPKGFDLATYAGVKRQALAIYAHTAPTSDMPPDAEGKWSANRRQTFLNWIMQNYPMGVAEPDIAVAPPQGEPLSTTRVRKAITALTPAEIETLKTAFRGLMARDPAQADSYYAIAAIHGLPQQWCSHHIDQYNPWHRVYLKTFEDALRSVPGCEAVTLPYWDILTPIPPVLQEEPFASYVLPMDPGAAAHPPQPGVFFPYATSRYSPEELSENVAAFDLAGDIATSKIQTVWGAFNTNGYQDFSIQAHDGGHLSIGPTMAAQEVASYDPIFWLFHCNLDRLWWRWQEAVKATTLAGFKSTITSGDLTWLDGPAPLNSLQPFNQTTAESLDMEISYEDEAVATPVSFENALGSMEAARSFSIRRSTPVSVRVKDIARLRIPGSFVVRLMADGETIAKRAFFQPDAPQNCPTCVANALVNIDFRLDAEQLLDKTLSVGIEVPSHREMGERFPLSEAGNPSVNVRFLLHDQ